MMEGANQVAVTFVIEYLTPVGGHLRDEEIHLWTFNDAGKVCALRHYVDTAKHIAAWNLDRGWHHRALGGINQDTGPQRRSRTIHLGSVRTQEDDAAVRRLRGAAPDEVHRAEDDARGHEPGGDDGEHHRAAALVRAVRLLRAHRG